jgi:hypothetical protein
MANDAASFSRFSAMPSNISLHGYTQQEVQSQHGKPDANPVASPMPNPAVSESRLALQSNRTDQMRVGLPSEPDANPYRGPRSTLSLNRDALRKLSSNIVNDLRKSVSAGAVGDPNLNNLMKDSLRRLDSLCGLADNLQKMAEKVRVLSIAASKG